MKKFRFVLFSLLFLLGMGHKIYATEDVTITSFDLSMVIDEQGLIQAHQSIDAQFNIVGHGIYAYIPQRYEMIWANGSQPISYYFPVRNIQVEDWMVETSTDDYDNVVIKIGDPDQTITGPQSYRYAYTLQLRDLGLDGQQALYLNIVGDGWEMPMDRVSFSITLPSAWPSEVHFYSGYAGSQYEADVTYSIQGNTLTGILNGSLDRYEALTIFAPLPNQPFTFSPPPDYTWIGLGLSIGLLILIYLIYVRYGKDDPVIDVVEFYPVPNISSAMSGFIYDGFVDTKDVISLIIEWAYKGYLRIDEDKNKKDFTLTLLKPIATTEIRAEQTLFNQLFDGKESVTNADLENRFYTSIQNAKSDILRYFQGNKEHAIFDNKATAFKVLLAGLVLIPLAIGVASSFYRYSYQETVAWVAFAFTWAIGTGLMVGWIVLIKKKPSLSKVGFSASLIALSVLTLLFILIVWGLTISMGGSVLFNSILTVLSLISAGYVTVMDKRTPKGTELLGHLRGLKNFIEVAEKDKLELLVHEDPSYFYRVLPYAYVLNVSDVWSKKFESIAVPQPQWYGGTTHFNTVLFMRSFNHTLSSMSHVMTSIPQKGGSGGFGSGGGGFSGGGFGGGGGGHW